MPRGRRPVALASRSGRGGGRGRRWLSLPATSGVRTRNPGWSSGVCPETRKEGRCPGRTTRVSTQTEPPTTQAGAPTEATHPALEQPVPEGPGRDRMDWLVFGVTAAIAVAFVAWVS